MRKIASLVLVAVALAMVFTPSAFSKRETIIKIGINAPMTGDIPKVGEGSKYAAEMWLEDIEKAGGLEVGGKKYKVEVIIEDNESKAESAVKANTKMISQDDVLAIVGPQSSKQAIPAGEVANKYKTVMISPWSTNPDTTANRPYVFRGCFLDPFQGPVLANFITEEFGFTKAAVLYDVSSDYPKGLAEVFKEAWEKKHGPGSVVEFLSFTTKDTDFSSQLTDIIKSDAQVLFTPQYYNEVPLIVNQAKDLGWKGPVVGSDSWGSAELVQLCGEACYGQFFSSHYAASGAIGATKEFIDRYNAKYGYIPDDVGALTWDALKLVQQAIQNTGKLTGNIEKDRTAVRDALAKIKNFAGITGNMTFTEEGDPIKCAVIVKINDKGENVFYKSSCP
ncbi:MAG: ABC transporter substrate-binding protein [Pseudomonadota bacterium]